MNTQTKNKETHDSDTQLHEFFIQQVNLERKKIESRKKVMDNQFKKATKGKKFIISNITK